MLTEVTVVPRDGYGNFLGPGRSDAFDVGLVGGEGSEFLSDIIDLQDGSYSVPIVWITGQAPNLILAQRGRAPMDFGRVPEPRSGVIGLLLTLVVICKMRPTKMHALGESAKVS